MVVKIEDIAVREKWLYSETICSGTYLSVRARKISRQSLAGAFAPALAPEKEKANFSRKICIGLRFAKYIILVDNVLSDGSQTGMQCKGWSDP